MSYRPKNWEKIRRRDCYDGEDVYRELDTYEAGADAMLGAILIGLLDKKIKFKRKKGVVYLEEEE